MNVLTSESQLATIVTSVTQCINAANYDGIPFTSDVVGEDIPNAVWGEDIQRYLFVSHCPVPKDTIIPFPPGFMGLMSLTPRPPG